MNTPFGSTTSTTFGEVDNNLVQALAQEMMKLMKNQARRGGGVYRF